MQAHRLVRPHPVLDFGVVAVEGIEELGLGGEPAMPHMCRTFVAVMLRRQPVRRSNAVSFLIWRPQGRTCRTIRRISCRQPARVFRSVNSATK